jgi:aminoglycoside phosphotransferase (APT) family kinase protein
MDSKTKTTLTDKTIQTLAKAQFGNSVKIKEITPLTAGMFNTAYAIHFENLKPDVVLRVAPHPDQPVLTYEENMMQREGLILETIQQVEGLPFVPRLLGYDFSRQLIERDYMFIEKLSGVPLWEIKDELTPENMHALEFQVGRYIAQLGQVKGEYFGYFGEGPGHNATSWQDAFVAMMEALLDDGETLDAELPVSYDLIREQLHRHAASLDEVREPSFVHWDLWQGNVFVKPENGAYVIEGIIDWERAFWGDPDCETPVAARFYGPSFYKGYGKELAEGGPAAIRQSLYRIYLWLVLLIEIKVRDYEPDYLPWPRAEIQKDVAFLQSTGA